jgi:hypothetical protein
VKGQLHPGGVAGQGQLADQEVLGDPHVGGPEGRLQSQGQCAVGVVDDGDLAGTARAHQVGGLVEQQPVGRVDRDELRRLDVRVAAQDGEQLLRGPDGHLGPYCRGVAATRSTTTRASSGPASSCRK